MAKKSWLTPHVFLTYPKDSEKLCCNAIESQKSTPREDLFLAITTKEEPNKAIGFVGGYLKELIWDDAPAYLDMCYNLHTDFQGNGYASEAAAAMADYFFKEFGLNYVNATSHPQNQASHKVLHRLGFRKYGDIIKKYDSVRYKFKLTKKNFYKKVSSLK